MKRYRVKAECIDCFYGREASLEYIQECQRRGIPDDDLSFMIREYGTDIFDLLEEI